MRRIRQPSYNATDVFVLCAQTIRDIAKRDRLLSVLGEIGTAAEEYIQAATRAILHRISTTSNVGGAVSKTEMMGLYKRHMARKSGSARGVYEHLMSAAQHRRCPLCGQRTVSTLDHHLPESLYPIFAVFAHNLVPTCKDCNKEKGTARPDIAEHQSIHPYFDDFETERWLYAGVLHSQPAAIHFFVNPPAHWTNVKKRRAKYHFSLLRLGELYTSHGAEELLNLRYGLSKLWKDAGSGAVRQHLTSEAESRSSAHVNSWQTAMYEALASDDWFCNGGFQYF